MNIQTPTFTVDLVPSHLRVGDSVERPISVLFDDEVLATVAELRLSVREATGLMEALRRLITAAKEG